MKRTGEYFAWTAEGSQAWDALATAARQGVAELSRSEVGMESAARFLAGAAKDWLRGMLFSMFSEGRRRRSIFFSF